MSCIRPCSPKTSDVAASSSLETIVSTASTIPCVRDDDFFDDVCSIPSTIDLEIESDEEVIELYTHHIAIVENTTKNR